MFIYNICICDSTHNCAHKDKGTILQCFCILDHLEVGDPHQDVVDLVSGHGVGVPQLLGELVHPPDQQHLNRKEYYHCYTGNTII